MTYAVVDGPFGSFLDRVRVNGLSADATGIQRRKCRRTRQTTDVGCQNALFASSHRCSLKLAEREQCTMACSRATCVSSLDSRLEGQEEPALLKPLPLLNAPRY